MWSRSWRHATDRGEIAKVGAVPAVMDVPVFMPVKVPQIQFIAGVSGHSSSQRASDSVHRAV